MVGTLIAAGVPPWFMVAHSKGESFEGVTGADGRPASEADRAAGAVFRLHRGLPAIGPGSLRMALTAMSNPLRHTPLQHAVGWLPAGIISTDSLKELVRRVADDRWIDHPNLWTVACDYGTGRRIAFGRTDAPTAHIADAVAASCAIPGFYRPVKIGARRYVDGGVVSASNLDLLAGRGLDLVICLNPLSSRDNSRPLNPLDWAGALSRDANGRRLGREARRVREYGTKVVLVQPQAEDLAVMGRNLMSPDRRDEVIRTAERTVADQLRATGVHELLEGLPEGEPHKLRRPSGPASEWPAITPNSRRAA
jgi:NTE family protein